MILKFHHIGITVLNLPDAQDLLREIYPCTHAQADNATPSCLAQVSLQPQSHFGLSLHARPDSLDVELMAYPQAAPAVERPLTPFAFESTSPVELASRVRAHVAHARERSSTTYLARTLAALPRLNAVVVPVACLAEERPFWLALGFSTVLTHGTLEVLALAARIPPVGTRYVILDATGSASPRYTDMQGISEIALMASSCCSALARLPEASFRTEISCLVVAGRLLELAFTRSPSGILVELFALVRP